MTSRLVRASASSMTAASGSATTPRLRPNSEAVPDWPVKNWRKVTLVSA